MFEDGGIWFRWDHSRGAFMGLCWHIRLCPVSSRSVMGSMWRHSICGVLLWHPKLVTTNGFQFSNKRFPWDKQPMSSNLSHSRDKNRLKSERQIRRVSSHLISSPLTGLDGPAAAGQLKEAWGGEEAFTQIPSVLLSEAEAGPSRKSNKIYIGWQLF